MRLLFFFSKGGRDVVIGREWILLQKSRARQAARSKMSRPLTCLPAAWVGGLLMMDSSGMRIRDGTPSEPNESRLGLGRKGTRARSSTGAFSCLPRASSLSLQRASSSSPPLNLSQFVAGAGNLQRMTCLGLSSCSLRRPPKSFNEATTYRFINSLPHPIFLSWELLPSPRAL